MADETKHGVGCTEFEALLSEAMDEGGLSGARREGFEAHRRVCAVCGPMLAEVKAGREWLRTLEPIEPPVHLVHNILAATSGVVSTRSSSLAATAGGRTTPLGERLRERWDALFTPLATFVRQPRFVMSFGMIFFSLSLGLNVAGVKPKDVAKVDLRPAALRHAYNDAQIKVVKYYDNIRFVYEIESKLRELKKANTPAEPVEQKQNPKNKTSGQPEERQDRNYSREDNQMVLAAMTGGTNEVRSYELRAANCEPTQPPVVTVTTNGRFV